MENEVWPTLQPCLDWSDPRTGGPKKPGADSVSLSLSLSHDRCNACNRMASARGSRGAKMNSRGNAKEERGLLGPSTGDLGKRWDQSASKETGETLRLLGPSTSATLHLGCGWVLFFAAACLQRGTIGGAAPAVRHNISAQR